MQRTVLTSFVWLVALAIAVQAAVIPNAKPKERNGFKLLGSIEKSREVTLNGVSSVIFEDWYYWESVNAASWAEAQRDCKANGDTLLNLETREEVDNVTRWLQDTDNTGSRYWIGGKYDSRSTSFKWDNGVPLSPDAPWGANQPREKKPNTRVAASTIGREIELITQANTVANRYICESERPDDGEDGQIPEPCYKDNDLLIVVDSSSSIADPHYLIAKEFTSRLATTWVDHTGSRVSVLIYSNEAKKIFGLKDDQSVATIKKRIYQMEHIKSNTQSFKGLSLATNELQTNERGVPKNIVFLTDGVTYPTHLKPKTNESAKKANDLGIRTFSVGIGDGIDQEELLTIAGGNAEHVFTTDQFDELLNLLRPLSIKVCKA